MEGEVNIADTVGVDLPAEDDVRIYVVTGIQTGELPNVDEPICVDEPSCIDEPICIDGPICVDGQI